MRATRPRARSAASHVYRVDPASGDVEAVVTDMVQPNGLAFSLDETQLYVVDTGRTHGAQNPAHMRVFDVGKAGNKAVGRSRLRRLPQPACSTASGSTRAAASGRAPPTASIATIRTAR